MLTTRKNEAPMPTWQGIRLSTRDYLENQSRTKNRVFILATGAQGTAGTADTVVLEAGTHLAAQPEPGKPRVTATPSSVSRPGVDSLSCADCPEMIPIPGNNFAIGKYTVTFEEWDKCVADGGCGGYQPPDNAWGRGNRPVINVNWNDAQAYVQWLSRKTGKAYRLPTAEEWEIAARAGTTTNYYWGNDVGRNNANCDGCGSEWDNRKTAPVGSFRPNAFGLYDMMGNVWQWTDSCWKDNCARRLFFGGSWNHRPEDMRTTTRSWFDTSKRMRYLGFRVALTLP
jgi:formylglycine-generating enzyme required for sulfatase activity